MKLSSVISVVTALVVAVMFGCSSDECLENKNALPLAGFYNSYNPTQQISVDSLEVYGVGVPGDSILWKGDASKNELYLPFSLESDTTRYVFRYLHKELARYDLSDTLTFVYDRIPRFVSSACGVSYLFKMQEIKSSGLLIDSVTCPSGEVSNVDSQNLRIYFRASTSEEE